MKNLTTLSLQPEWIESLFDRVAELKSGKPPIDRLRRKVLALCFFENSTRTKLSFQLAAKKLGITVLDLDPDSSSLKKGESYGDTLRTMQSMGADIFVIRSGDDSFIERHKNDVRVPMISGGQGMSDHPTQSLLDAYTILENHHDLTGREKPRVCLVGDLLHSRVASSALHIFRQCGIVNSVCAPQELMPKEDMEGVTIHDSLKTAAANSDYLMALRIQKERFDDNESLEISSERLVAEYQISEEVFKSNPQLRILHPGPVNWDVEISKSLRDHDHSLIDIQVRNGVYIRMALLEKMLLFE